MAEQKEYKASKELQVRNAKFIAIVEEPKTGKNKKGEDWKLCKGTFKLEGRDKENKFLMWDLRKDDVAYKSMSDLKPFNNYQIVWKEKDESYNGNEWVSKTIITVKDGLNDKETQAVNILKEKNASEEDWIATLKDGAGCDEERAKTIYKQYK